MAVAIKTMRKDTRRICFRADGMKEVGIGAGTTNSDSIRSECNLNSPADCTLSCAGPGPGWPIHLRRCSFPAGPSAT